MSSNRTRISRFVLWSPPLLCAALTVLVTGCYASDASDASDASEPATELLTEDEAGVAEASLRVGASWRPHVDSPDPLLRAAAADAIVADPGDDGEDALQHLLQDSHARVRERAISTLAHLRRAEAVPRLRQFALSDPSEEVAAYAQAVLYRVRQEANEPPRGFLAMEHPEVFALDEPFELRLRVGASEDVPRAHVSVKLPPGLTLVSPGEPVWHGAVQHDRTVDLVLVVKPVAEVAGPVRVRVMLDYPEALDAEILKQSWEVEMDGSRGSIAEPGPLSVERAP